MKVKRQINQRTYKKFKKMLGAAALIFGVQYFSERSMTDLIDVATETTNTEYDFSLPFVNAAVDEDEFPDIYEGDLRKKDGNLWFSSTEKYWEGKQYENVWRHEGAMGYVEEFWSEQHCHSYIMIPGTSLLNNGLMSFAYLCALGWLFLGIAIISDIFMESIEVITAQTREIELFDKEAEKKFVIEVNVWNETVANLTLMALGSSAPEILLSVIQTVQDIYVEPPVLGASTIVGSAAFNLLVISGLSIYAVDEEPKAVKNTGVFAITSTVSLFAYIWLYMVLELMSPNQVTVVEAWLTLIYFVLLIVFAYAADVVQKHFREQAQSEQDVLEKNNEDERKIKKNELRQIAKSLEGDSAFSLVVQIAQGIQTEETRRVEPKLQSDIIMLYKQILEVQDLNEVDTITLFNCLKTDVLLDRFAYRKQAGMNANNKDFIKLKGSKGQVESAAKNVQNENELIGFKCLHYSVTESNGTVEVTIVKKRKQEYTFGIRTKDITATSPKDYQTEDKIVTMKANEIEMKFNVPIVDDEEWEPDLDFAIELYDPNTEMLDILPGDDTKCVVTILDEDFPGTLGFESTDVSVQKGKKEIVVVVKRENGSDGTISCMIKTDAIAEQKTPQTAVEFDDYCPMMNKITFPHSETEVRVAIPLVDKKVSELGGKLIEETDKLDENKEEDDEDSEEEVDVMFQVKLFSPEPAGVKISKKNTCIVTICKSDEAEEEMKKKQQLFEYFMNQQSPSWAQQFVNACLLGPTIDEDSMVLEDVSLFQALTHFCSIGWNVIFALVPPADYWNGKGCFVMALAMIGVVTAIVGEIATVFGCVIGLRQSVTAITFVALGTSLPDTFASMTAARNADSADDAIGNITGSNSVNVFLGLGLPWVIATMVWSGSQDDPRVIESAKAGLIPGNYVVPAGELGFSVFVFLVVACVCFVILIVRRCTIGGELGGPYTSKLISCILTVSLWFFYILMSTLQAYGIISFPK